MNGKCPWLCIRSSNIVEISMTHSNLQTNAITIKIPTAFFFKIDNNKMCMAPNGHQVSKAILTKNKGGYITLPDYKLYSNLE